MTEHIDSDISREEQNVMSDDQEDQQKQKVAEHHEDRSSAFNRSSTFNKQPPDQDDYPIRIHDPDIESVVGLGYD